MSPPSVPALCEVEGVQPCGELIALRDKVAKQERRISSAIDDGSDTAAALITIAERVGVMRPDGTATPHSLTAAVQTSTNEVLAIKRLIESARAPSEPPQQLLDAIGDLSEASRVDIQRPDLAIIRRRKAIKQRNWVAVIAGVITLALGIVEAILRMKGH